MMAIPEKIKRILSSMLWFGRPRRVSYAGEQITKTGPFTPNALGNCMFFNRSSVLVNIGIGAVQYPLAPWNGVDPVDSVTSASFYPMAADETSYQITFAGPIGPNEYLGVIYQTNDRENQAPNLFE